MTCLRPFSQTLCGRGQGFRPTYKENEGRIEMNFARNVHFTVKNGKADEFNRLIDTEILPLLKKEKGFKQDLTVLTHNNGTSISVWDDRASADAYNTKTYPEVLKKLQSVLEGTPRVETCDSMHSLVH
jgi:quinol monooxygenase YgiN